MQYIDDDNENTKIEIPVIVKWWNYRKKKTKEISKKQKITNYNNRERKMYHNTY